MDTYWWRWIWLAVTAVFAIGEIFTAGFFMLPFAVGAVVAFILALLDVDPAIVLTVFLVVSVLTLVLFQRLVRKGDRQEQHPVGANRYLGRRVLVLERIDRVAGTGKVRLETETWRATTDGDPIEEGAEVRVVEMRGTRLVVAPED